MRDYAILGPWVRRFLLEHLVAERNLSCNTQASYRDSLTLLLPFISHHAKSDVDRLKVEDVSADRVRAFLEHVERDRRCSVLTRNQRLAAIHSLARYIGARSPEHVAWCAQVRSVPFKKAPKAVISYLDKTEVDALLRAPDRRTALGARDHALLLFLYNSGAWGKVGTPKSPQSHTDVSIDIGGSTQATASGSIWSEKSSSFSENRQRADKCRFAFKSEMSLGLNQAFSRRRVKQSRSR